MNPRDVFMKELEDKIKELEDTLKWKDKLLINRTNTLYNLIQQAQDTLNTLPKGMID